MKDNKIGRIKRKLSLFLNYLGIKIRLPEKPFSEAIAEGLYSLFIWEVTIAFLIAFFGIMGIASASSEADIVPTFQYTGYALMIVYAPFMIFQVFYVGFKIMSKLENLSPLSKYNILRIGRKPLLMGFLGGVFLTLSLILTQLMNVIGIELGENEIINKAYTSFSIISFSLVIVSIPAMMTFSMQLEKEMEISLTAIQSFEDIAEKSKTNRLAAVWIALVRNVVYGAERFVKRHVGISKAKFYKPFNIISLAAILGNNEERNKAKEWIEQLGKILENKELEEPTKAAMILDHMEQVEQKKEFAEILRKHEKHGLEYRFESSWRRIGQRFGTIERVILLLVGIATFILTIIKFFVFEM